METSSSEEDLLLSLLVDIDVAERRKKSKRRMWIHNINRKREKYGEFHHLFSDLQQDQSKFFQYFRMSYEKFWELQKILEPHIVKQNTKFRRSIPTEERLAVCLRFLATGDTFRTIAFSYRLGESTVREITYDVCKAMWNILQPLVMPTPTKATWERIEREFAQMWNFPNCIGAVDGKHVIFDKPKNTGSLYFNYKKSFSIVLLGLVDANYKFIAIDVGAYGRNSDGGIFANSVIGKKLALSELNIPTDKPLPGTDIVTPYVFVADEAFALQRHLLRPYPGTITTGVEKNKIFNYRLSRARRVSENCFGILVKRFRLYQRRLQISPEHMDTIILATCVLHNFLGSDTLGYIEGYEADNRNENEGIEAMAHIGGRSPTVGLQVRELFTNYFNSNIGSVPWQNEIVRRGRLNFE